MKRKLLLVPVLAGSLWLSGCASMFFTGPILGGRGSSDDSSSASGIDPVTMSAIDASNQATSDSIQQENQWQMDQTNNASPPPNP